MITQSKNGRHANCLFLCEKTNGYKGNQNRKKKQTAIITINVVSKDTMSTTKTRTGGQL